MPTDPPSAAASLYPHLPSDKPIAPSSIGRTESSLATAMYPRPQPTPLTHREIKNLWRDKMLEMAGLRRRR